MSVSSCGWRAFWQSDATLPGRVLALERGEVDHRDREFQAEDLGVFLDAAGGVFGDALLDADLIDRSDFIEQARKAWEFRMAIGGGSWESGGLPRFKCGG